VNNQIIKNKNNEKKEKTINLCNENKRELSVSTSPSQSPSDINIKKAKLFVTPNRYSVLSIDESNVDNDVFDDTVQEKSITVNNVPKSTLHPPIFIKGILDFIGLRNNIIDIIGQDSFFCKSTSSNLKIQTDTPDNYRNLIRFLKNINAQFHTYQL